MTCSLALTVFDVMTASTTRARFRCSLRRIIDIDHFRCDGASLPFFSLCLSHRTTVRAPRDIFKLINERERCKWRNNHCSTTMISLNLICSVLWDANVEIIFVSRNEQKNIMPLLCSAVRDCASLRENARYVKHYATEYWSNTEIMLNMELKLNVNLNDMKENTIAHCVRFNLLIVSWINFEYFWIFLVYGPWRLYCSKLKF